MLFVSQTNAFIIDIVYEGTIIQPNSTSSGYYITNNTVKLTQLVVNETHVDFGGLDSNNQTVFEINATGAFVNTLCYGSSTCIIPQISTIKDIYFTLDNIAPNYSGFVKSPASAALAGVYHTIYINVSETNILSEVWVEIDSATNYSMTDDIGDRYNYTFVLHTVGTHTYKVYMNDSAGNLNSTNLISFAVTAPTSPGGGGGNGVPIPPVVILKDYNYTVDPPTIDFTADAGTTFDGYFKVISLDEKTIYLKLTVECIGADVLCENIYYITKRTLLGEEYNEGTKSLSIYVAPYTEGGVSYEIKIPDDAPEDLSFKEVLNAMLVLTDESNGVTKIPISISINRPDIKKPLIEKIDEALDTEIFTIRGNRISPDEHIVTYMHATVLGVLGIFALLVYKLWGVYGKRRRKNYE